MAAVKASLRVLRGTGVTAQPRCSACGIVVDLAAPDHHVCVPDGAGGFTAATQSVARARKADPAP